VVVDQEWLFQQFGRKRKLYQIATVTIAQNENSEKETKKLLRRKRELFMYTIQNNNTALNRTDNSKK